MSVIRAVIKHGTEILKGDGFWATITTVDGREFTGRIHAPTQDCVVQIDIEDDRHGDELVPVFIAEQHIVAARIEEV